MSAERPTAADAEGRTGTGDPADHLAPGPAPSTPSTPNTPGAGSGAGGREEGTRPEAVPHDRKAVHEQPGDQDEPGPRAEDGTPWERLDIRMIWADAVRVLLSLSPAAIALLIVGVEPRPDVIWPVVIIAVWGAVGAGRDALRWVTTRYRITPDYVERRTGLFVRTYRSVRRERIRSVDADARLLQRLVGLRRVRIGAGQVNTAMESALVLDAVTKDAASRLRQRLLTGADREAARSATAVAESPAQVETPAREGEGPNGVERSPGAPGAAPDDTSGEQVFSGLRWWWVFYNMASVWSFFMAAGLLWGGYWMLTMFGLDPTGWLRSLADWESLGWAWTTLVAVLATGILGSLGMGFNFFSEHWNFRLVRVPGDDGTLLRTTQGLFKTREVNRDDKRLRGLSISQPLLWRWMRMADTSVITTGLSMWSMSATILPRGPLPVARKVAAAVLDTAPSPLEAPLTRHPAASLRRRLVWAVLVTATVTGVLFWVTTTTELPDRTWWITGLVLAALSLGLAVAGYRSLAHGFSGEYVVVRAGAVSRVTTALQGGAVSGVRIKQSLFQRRLGLATVGMSTAAGWGGYNAVDMAAEESVDFADRALPLGLDAFRADTAPAPESSSGAAES